MAYPYIPIDSITNQRGSIFYEVETLPNNSNRKLPIAFQVILIKVNQTFTKNRKPLPPCFFFHTIDRSLEISVSDKTNM